MRIKYLLLGGMMITGFSNSYASDDYANLEKMNAIIKPHHPGGRGPAVFLKVSGLEAQKWV
jgi:hypothetical protein